MTAILFAAVLVLPWVGAGILLWRSSERFPTPRTVIVAVTILVAAGCIGLALLDAVPALAFGESPDMTESATMASRLAWSADRFSLVMVAALMTMIAATAVLLQDESPPAGLLTLLIAACVPTLWWSQSVWGIAGVSVVISFLSLILPTAIAPAGTAGASRTMWLSTTVGDVLLVMAIVAGIGGLGDASTVHYSDPVAVQEFATMRTATGMFVAYWSWLGVLCRACQFPLCVNFDAVRTFRSRAWVISVGFGVFVVGQRWCDLHRGWWAASPPMTNLILSAALVSALLCAWFALCTPELRVRVAFLTAAHLSLAFGPLTTGTEIDRVWAAASMLGILSLAMWLWSVTSTQCADDAEPDAAPAWVRILTGEDTKSIVWTFFPSARAAPSPSVSTIPVTAHGFAKLVVLLWCGLSISIGSWWWEEEPPVDVASLATAAETSPSEAEVSPGPLPTRPKGRLPVCTFTVMLIAAGIASGIRSASCPGSIGASTERTPWLASAVLCFVPAGLVIALSRPEVTIWPLIVRGSPALLCLGLIAAVVGWVCAGWPEDQRQKLRAALTVVRRLGERRLLIPELLHFGANFPLRGSAQLFRFLDWSVIEKGCWSNLRRVPETLRRFRDEVRGAGHGTEALALLLSGVALVTTVVWLAHTAR